MAGMEEGTLLMDVVHDNWAAGSPEEVGSALNDGLIWTVSGGG